MDKVIIVGGPTGSGKSAVAVEIAKQLNGEIISSDSMQIYKKMDIGTAKITEAEMQQIPHHLLSIVDLKEQFSVAEFKKRAELIIKDILSRGKTPIVCGGTGLYIESLVKNISFTEEINTEPMRLELEALAEEKGVDYMHDMLMKLDPECAEKIHKNNLKRVIRAIIANRLSETTFSDAQKQAIANAPEFDYRLYVLETDREVLYNRINKRVDEMFEEGLLAEAKLLYDLGIEKQKTASQAIGYKELFKFFNGEEDLDTAKERIKKGTRNYAKRQITWFKRYEEAIWISTKGKNKEELALEIIFHEQL